MNECIKLDKSLLGWRWISSPPHVAVYVNLLLRCNFQEKEFFNETILPGQILTGRKQLSDWTGLTEKQIRKVLDDLEKSKEIDRKSTNKYSIITITNWSHFQTEGQQESNKGQTEGQQESNKGPHPKNDKKEKKESSGPVDNPPSKKSTNTHDAFKVLEHYNIANGKSLKHVGSNYKQINARLREGFTVAEMIELIDYASKSWASDDFWSAYNTPYTLFNTKMDQYLDKARSATRVKPDPLDVFFAPYVKMFEESRK